MTNSKPRPENGGGPVRVATDPTLAALKDIRDALRETNLRLTDIYHMVRLNCRETKRLDSRLSRRIPLNKVAKCKK